MIEKTIFPREEKAEVLFDKILSDKWAYNKLFQTFCDIAVAASEITDISRHIHGNCLFYLRFIHFSSSLGMHCYAAVFF